MARFTITDFEGDLDKIITEHPEWEPHLPFPWKKIALTDGTTLRGREVMRRRAPDGSWEYRRMTEEEAATEFRLGSW